MSAAHQSLVTAVIDGKPYGEWSSRSGGDPTAENSKYRPAGGRKQKVRKGLSDYSDVVIGREKEHDVDYAVERQLRPRVGRANAIITDQPLDWDDVPFGKPTVFIGVLMGMSGGESDANSDDGMEFELTFIITEVS